jgi:hypothetical protein
MLVIVKKYKLEDTMAKMEMERALAKLKLGPKKDPNELQNKFTSGMVQTWVGQKHLKRDILRLFLMSKGTIYLR